MLDGHVVPVVSALIVACVSVFLLLQVGWFIFSCFLLKKNRNNNILGVKSMIKIANFIIGSVEALLSAIVTIFSIGSFIYLVFEQDPYYHGNLVILGVFVFIFIASLMILTLASLMLHGVRTSSPRIMKPWIIFKKKFFCFFLAVSLASCISFGI